MCDGNCPDCAKRIRFDEIGAGLDPLADKQKLSTAAAGNEGDDAAIPPVTTPVNCAETTA